MDILVNELPKEKIRFFAGADQLGLLLLSRAANRLQYELPLVNVTYAAGMGGKTVPTYEDDTVAVSAKQHIYAAGAFPVYSRKNADLVLAVNTPADGVTHEASDASNSYKALPATVNFVNKVERILEHNHPVTVAISALATVRIMLWSRPCLTNSLPTDWHPTAVGIPQATAWALLWRRDCCISS